MDVGAGEKTGDDLEDLLSPPHAGQPVVDEGDPHSRYTLRISSAVLSHVKCSTRERPFLTRSSRSPASFQRTAIFSASSPEFPGSKRRAASPTASGREAALEEMTGVPEAMASRGGRPNPSERDGNTQRRAFLSS